MTKQVKVSFSIGKYEDDVQCDGIPMHASHIILGCQWSFDKQVIHGGFTKKYSFEYNQKKVLLVPLTPKQVYEDQVQLQKEVGKVNSKEQTVETNTSGLMCKSLLVWHGNIEWVMEEKRSLQHMLSKENAWSTNDLDSLSPFVYTL